VSSHAAHRDIVEYNPFKIVRDGRRLQLRLAVQWPWARDLTTVVSRLRAPSHPANQPQSSRRPEGDRQARGTAHSARQQAAKQD
jgi:hypothetical protein